MTSISPGELSDPAVPKAGRGALALTGLAALGIVFGDIGTSPLYTLKTAFDFLQGDATPDRILGILSLLIWTLFVVTSVKYVIVAMSIDNDGEGGILALMSLLGVKQGRPAIVVSGPARRGADLWRRRDHAGDFRAVGARGASTSRRRDWMPMWCRPLSSSWRRCSRSNRSAPRGSAPLSGRSWRSGFVSIGALGLWGIAQDPWVFVAVNPLLRLSPPRRQRAQRLFCPRRNFPLRDRR